MSAKTADKLQSMINAKTAGKLQSMIDGSRNNADLEERKVIALETIAEALIAIVAKGKP
jgi:hypothetical protein